MSQQEADPTKLEPVIFIAPLVAGLALHFVSPIRFLPTGWVQFAIGAPIFIPVALLWVQAARALRAKADSYLFKYTTAVVTHGPYRFSRNPLYLSSALAYIAIAVLVNTLWVLVLTPLFVLLTTVGVIVREERFLERKFDDAYRNYKSKVRRWL